MNSDARPRLDLEAEETLLKYLMLYMRSNSFEERRYIQKLILQLEAWVQELKGCCENGGGRCESNVPDIYSESDFGFF